MVMKTPPISADVAARMAAENVRQFSGDAKAKESQQDTIVRMWCIEQAAAVCGTELGIMWHGSDQHKCAVVPIAEEILMFITAKNNE